MRLRLTGLVLALAGAHSLGAQAPRITAKGDPSVRADSIYKLAVDATKYPEQDAALLLDDGVIRLEADGRGTRTFRSIVQILRPGAVERFQEQSFSYSPGHEKLTVNWIRVVRPNGEVVSAKPSHVQESDVPAETDDPVYTDRKIRRMSLSGVAVGTIVDYSYTTEELKPFLPRDFYQSWGVSTGLQVARSRFVLDVPATLTPRIHERNLNFKRTEQTTNGRHVYTWATADLPKIKPEVMAADSNDVYMALAVSAPIEWQTIGKWYAGLAAPQMAPSAFVAARVDSIVRGAHTRADSIRAVHKWVAQDIRYVAIDLGMSGYQPRKPEQVVRTGFGDCKDKATLFVSALAHLGIEAHPVLLNSTGGVRREMPSIRQLDHEIAAVREGSGWHFVDLTAGNTPYDQLPGAEQGEFGLVVHPDGASEVVTLPQAPIDANLTTMRIAVAMDTAGLVSGSYEETGAGTAQYGLRNIFTNPLDSTQKANFANNLANKLFDGATGDSLGGFDGKDLQVVPHIRILIRNGRAATLTGTQAILHNPLASMSGLAVAARELEAREKRRFPLDPERFWGRKTTETDVTITLPAGWTAQAPKSVRASSAFGSYVSEYTATGNVLHMRRRITGASEVQPPEKVAELITWLKAIAADDAKLIMLNRGG
jgi:transglutaminase-like putative cysteine protease